MSAFNETDHDKSLARAEGAHDEAPSVTCDAWNCDKLVSGPWESNASRVENEFGNYCCQRCFMRDQGLIKKNVDGHWEEDYERACSRASSILSAGSPSIEARFEGYKRQPTNHLEDLGLEIAIGLLKEVEQILQFSGKYEVS